MRSIEVDFNNCDREGRVRLNTIGAIQSLNESKVTLRNGLEVELTSGDFFPTKGTVEYSDSEHIWVARFDIKDLRDREIESPSER
jgi:transcription antitermination factor NusG